MRFTAVFDTTRVHREVIKGITSPYGIWNDAELRGGPIMKSSIPSPVYNPKNVEDLPDVPAFVLSPPYGTIEEGSRRRLLEVLAEDHRYIVKDVHCGN